MLKRIFHSVDILLAILSVLWIITGSTIMFHQVYVYHNNVDLWQMQAINTNGKELKKCFQFVDNNPGTSFRLAFSNQINVNEFGLVALNLNERTIFSRYLYDLITPEYIYDRVLRGPPAA